MNESEEKVLRSVRDSIQSALTAPVEEVGAFLAYSKNMLDIILYEGRKADAEIQED